MKDLAQGFSQNFILTGESSDPKDLDFTINTHEKIINDKNGVLVSKEYYMNYDPNTGDLTDLAVKANYTYGYDSNNVLVKRLEEIDWYLDDGSIGTSRLTAQVYETQK